MTKNKTLSFPFFPQTTDDEVEGELYHLMRGYTSLLIADVGEGDSESEENRHVAGRGGGMGRKSGG